MKKTIFFLMAVVGLFTACDPSQSEKNFDPVALSSDSRPQLVISSRGGICLCVQCKFNTLGFVVQILRKAGTSSKVNRYNKPTEKSFAYTQTIVRLYPNDYSPIRIRLFAYRQIYCINSDVFFYRYLLVRLT